jgi:O-acetyl-ADP-ribose deacetylase (regulator of RNase III)
VMGKGVALQFKQRFPKNYLAYVSACQRGALGPGGIFPFFDEDSFLWIINVATKNHWRNPSKLEWVDLGARLIRSHCDTYGIPTVAIPPLGCGNGGLDWADVRPIIDREFSRPYLMELDRLTAFVYEP